MGIVRDALRFLFNPRADDVELPETEFCSYLNEVFDRNTAARVLDVFKKMNIPAPEKNEEFMEGQEGGLVFLNKYGLVVRIEKVYTDESGFKSHRVNDDAWILRPLASIKTGKAIVEICPGCRQEQTMGSNEYLSSQLRKHGIEFWDCKISNIGLIPIASVKFPNGMPVVIDRLAVKKLTDDINPARRALKFLMGHNINNATREMAKIQKDLYLPLKRALDAAWPDKSGGEADARKMDEFLSLCRLYVDEGKLVAGWNEPQSEVAANEKCKIRDNSKTPQAAKIAKSYEARFG